MLRSIAISIYAGRAIATGCGFVFNEELTMKNLTCVLMICLGVVSCAVSDRDDGTAATEDELAASAAEANVPAPSTASTLPVRGDELTTYGEGKQTNSCARDTDGACIDQFLQHTCNFVCCSNAYRTVLAVCGQCNARASSWCGSGVHATWWTF
jgi:hypothetical protein